MEDRCAAQPSNLPVVGEAPCERREIPVLATEPVAAETPRSVSEGAGYLQVAEPHDKIATDVLGDIKTSSSPVHSERPEESAVSAEASRTTEAPCVPMRNIAAAEPRAPFVVTDPPE